MELNKKLIIISAVIIGAATLGVLIYRFKVTSPITQPSPLPPPGQNQGGVEGEGDFGVIVEPTPPGQQIIKPNLDYPIVVSDTSLTADAAKDTVSKLKTAISAAQKNPADYQTWMDVGLYRKVIGDYKGASEVWLYVLNFQKKNLVAMGNLAGLYHRDLKEYLTAEKYYLTMLAVQPSNLEVYVNLHQLYRHQFTQKAAEAPAILKQGIEKNPDSILLMIELARYYKEVGDTSSARLYYEKAADTAKKAGDTRLETEIRLEAKGV